MADRPVPARRGASWSQARRADGLALRRAIPDRLLPVLVAAMAVLAAMALAGATGARVLSARWTTGAASIVTVQVPRPDDPARPGNGTPPPLSRADAVLAALADVPGASRVHRLDKAELEALLSPWLGHDGDFALALPAVIELHLDRAGTVDADTLAARLNARAPDTLVERNSLWSDRLGDLARSLQTCAILAVLIVVAVAAATIAATTHAGLGARRQAIELIHSLGATDGYIAGRFARRTAMLAFTGGLIGSLLALPLLVLLSRLAAPFAGATPPAMATLPDASRWASLLDALPVPLAVTLLSLAPAAALIGWLTTQVTVRTWLRRLP
ncbi:cell division protein FtsX [Gluconacetobacter johannae DSM 13595]|uniref:ABC transporter permease n=1 Tax=Gluconacetobacter johannae TaxID=112140 RepID=A0A7W4J9P4_9PROT|nr:FtsX-like permease family protein [Gluconacetobacter johannae]MBB2177062.1 ABC transporter permease [Gluconacetobacter johannae]GBQ90182.1 cell division protein FtsX [Gluconacetobacter johannae DSM 13595]